MLSKKPKESSKKEKSKNKKAPPDVKLMTDFAPAKLQEQSLTKQDVQEQEATLVEQLLAHAEKKYHQRVQQKFDLELIQKHLNQYLIPQVSARTEAFKSTVGSQSGIME